MYFWLGPARACTVTRALPWILSLNLVPSLVLAPTSDTCNTASPSPSVRPWPGGGDSNVRSSYGSSSSMERFWSTIWPRSRHVLRVELGIAVRLTSFFGRWTGLKRTCREGNAAALLDVGAVLGSSGEKELSAKGLSRFTEQSAVSV